MPNPASSYQTIMGVQPTPNLALTGNQQSNMGNQMQGMMVQYPPVQSYQVTDETVPVRFVMFALGALVRGQEENRASENKSVEYLC